MGVPEAAFDMTAPLRVTEADATETARLNASAAQRWLPALERVAALRPAVEPAVGALLQQTADGSHAVVTVTSAHAGAGVTTATLALAVALVGTGQGPVIIVDGCAHGVSTGDRTPARFADDLAHGSPQVLARLLTPLGVPGLSWLPANQAGLTHDGLLTEALAGRVFDLCRTEAPWVLCDAPPVLTSADTLLWSRASDHVVLVVAAHQTPGDQAQQAARRLALYGAPLRGVILNRQRSYLPPWLDRRL